MPKVAPVAMPIALSVSGLILSTRLYSARFISHSLTRPGSLLLSACLFAQKLRLDWTGEDAGLVAAIQQQLHRRAPAFAVAQRPLVDVHADELVREVRVHVAGKLQRVV